MNGIRSAVGDESNASYKQRWRRMKAIKRSRAIAIIGGNQSSAHQ